MELDITKLCNICHQHKEHYKGLKRGKHALFNPCIDCCKKEANIKNRLRKKKLVEYFGNKCHECGLVDDFCIYDFHHIKEKKRLVNATSSFNTSLEEAKNCIMLCCLCHRKLHIDISRSIRIPKNAIWKKCKLCKKKNPHRIKERKNFFATQANLKKREEELKNEMKVKWKLGKEISETKIKTGLIGIDWKYYCEKHFGFGSKNAGDYIDLYKQYPDGQNLPLSLNSLKLDRNDRKRSLKNIKRFYSNYICIYCRNKKGRIEHAKIRAKAMEYLGGKCQICGIDGEPYMFDFHHKNKDEKDCSISGRMSWEKLQQELDKCVLLCAHCHKKLHHERISRKLMSSEKSLLSLDVFCSTVSDEKINELV